MTLTKKQHAVLAIIGNADNVVVRTNDSTIIVTGPDAYMVLNKTTVDSLNRRRYISLDNKGTDKRFLITDFGKKYLNTHQL